MALASRATWQNLAKSLNVFIRTNLQVAQSLTVLYPGGELLDTLPTTQWLEVTYIPLAPMAFVHRAGSGETYANLAQILVNINILERLSTRQGEVATYTLATLADTVQNTFLPTKRIDITDYDIGGEPVVGKLFVSEVTRQPPVRVSETQVEALNVSARCRYLEIFTLT